MATWKAKCWLGSSSGYQNLEVQSNTTYGAEEQFKRIYGAKQVLNLRRANDSSSNFSMPSSGYGPALLALVILFVIIEYWWVVVPIASLLTLTYLYQRFKK